jgi:hypothetical protein
MRRWPHADPVLQLSYVNFTVPSQCGLTQTDDVPTCGVYNPGYAADVEAFIPQFAASLPPQPCDSHSSYRLRMGSGRMWAWQDALTSIPI